MYLTLNEMNKEKLRYGLIITVITLISYLIFILSALALGLAQQNTSAVNDWGVTHVSMTSDANGNLSQSLMTREEVLNTKTTEHSAIIGVAPTIVKSHKSPISATFIGTQKNDLIDKSIRLTKGTWPKNQYEVLISSELSQKGLNIGDKIKLGMLSHSVLVVGYVKKLEYNMSPVIYGDLNNWRPIKGVSDQFYASGIVRKDAKLTHATNLKNYTKAQLFNKMPGYSAQNKTFIFMIGFLLVISAVIVAIFLYILTIQKIPNLAVLRAQGVPGKYLVLNTLSETLIIMIVSVLISAILCGITVWLIPASVPMFFDIKLLSLAAIGLILTGIIGAIVPLRIITKIDPISVIGG